MDFRSAAGVQTLRSAESLFAVKASAKSIGHDVAPDCFQDLTQGVAFGAIHGLTFRSVGAGGFSYARDAKTACHGVTNGAKKAR
jgi:hypothetical protein